MIVSNLYQKREKQVSRIIYSKKNYWNFVNNKLKLNGKNGRINQLKTIKKFNLFQVKDKWLEEVKNPIRGQIKIIFRNKMSN
jgi:hypothetical protein